MRHVKMKLLPKLERQHRRDLNEHWANEYGQEIWWKSLPEGALNHMELCELAREVIKDTKFSRKLYVVLRGAHRPYPYMVTIHHAHLLNNVDWLFFDNYWMAYGFCMRFKHK